MATSRARSRRRLVALSSLVGLLAVAAALQLRERTTPAQAQEVAVTADVPSSMQCDVPVSAIDFGNVLPDTVRYGTPGGGADTESVAHTVTTSTNNASGFSITLQGPTPSTADHAISPLGPTPKTPVAGTESYGVRVTADGGSGDVLSPFDTPGYAYPATSDSLLVGTSSVASNPTTYSFYYASSTSTVTPPGTYTSNTLLTCVPQF